MIDDLRRGLQLFVHDLKFAIPIWVSIGLALLAFALVLIVFLGLHA